jgi:hypothetical protein
MFRDILSVMHSDWNHGRADYRWHYVMQQTFRLHPVVEAMLKHRPINPEKLALEWPYISEKDPMRLAYTRNPADGLADRQLVTSIGKYISRHWSHVPDHLRRDAASLYTPDTMYFAHTIKEMITGMELGPRSCMHSDYGSIPFDKEENIKLHAWLADPMKPEPNWDRHPYSCYLPKFGWHMAFRKDGMSGKVNGRVICLTVEENGQKIFVRTYARGRSDDASSETDTALAAWLTAQGYTRQNSWPVGQKISCPSLDDDGLQAPYLDGGRREIDQVEADIFEIVNENGEWRCDNTNGTADRLTQDEDDDEDSDSYQYCDCCDERYHVDEAHTVGRYQSATVCSYCNEHEYSLVRGSCRSDWHDSGNYVRYRVPNEEAGGVVGHSYEVDINELPDDVIELFDGRWAELDDTVCIDDSYYMAQDPDVVCLNEDNPDNGDGYALKTDTWTCAETGNVYHDNTDSVWVGGMQYHPDDAPDGVEDDDEEVLPPNAPIPVAVVEAAFPSLAIETLPATAQPGWPFAPKLEEQTLATSNI